MKKQIIRHGEVILKGIASIPKEARLIKEGKEIIVAHSETGHHHKLTTLDTSKIKVYEWNGDTYLEVPEISNLWHEKTGKEVHTPHKILPSAYKIVIKKEFDYFAGIIKKVRD